MKQIFFFCLSFALLSLSACKKENTSTTKTTSNTKQASQPKQQNLEIVVYSGRSKKLVKPILDNFTKATGIKVRVKYGKTSQLALLLKEETKQKKSPAHVFWAQDAGALSMLAKNSIFAPIPDSFLKKVPVMFRSANKFWIATSGRARVLAYSPKRVKPEQLPKTIFDLVKPAWKGKVGWAPTNASFQSFLTAVRHKHGEAKAEKWLRDMIANKAKIYPKNTPQIRAIAAGEIDLGLPNHYYLLRFKKKNANYPVEQTFFEDGSVGNLVNVAGVGILKGKKELLAKRFVHFLLGKETQQDLTNRVFEYPVTSEVKPHQRLLPQAALLKKSSKVALERLEDLQKSIALLRKVGLL